MLYCIADDTEQIWTSKVPYVTAKVTIKLSTRAIYINDYRLPLGELIIDCAVHKRWMVVHSRSLTKAYSELVDIRTKEVRILNQKHECSVDLLAETVTWPQKSTTLSFQSICCMPYESLPMEEEVISCSIPPKFPEEYQSFQY